MNKDFGLIFQSRGRRRGPNARWRGLLLKLTHGNRTKGRSRIFQRVILQMEKYGHLDGKVSEVGTKNC